VVIVGGASGIGRAVAERSVEAGARVTICSRRLAPLEETSRALGTLCRAIQADIRTASDRARLLRGAREHGLGIDALVHCAADIAVGPITGLEQAEVLRLFDNNVVGALMLTAEAVPDLQRSRGTVVFFSSTHTARPSGDASAYAATKGAIEAMTRALAAELAPSGIRVNCVRPGAVPTGILTRSGHFDEQTAAARLEGLAARHALGRLGTPGEVAQAVEYLLAAQWTTGTVLTVDGGLALGR
jgi:3-oxoacyl-[acyl-carrier protein] reductase